MRIRKTNLEDDREVFGSPNIEILEKPVAEIVKEPIDIETLMDTSPVGKFNTFIVIMVMNVILGVVAVVQLHFSTILYVVFLTVLMIFLNKSSKAFELDEDGVIYIRNVAHTLKTLFIRVLGFKSFFVNRKRNIIIASGVILLEQVIIRGILPYSFSMTIHYAALSVIFVSTLFIISTKEFKDLKQMGNVVIVIGSFSVVLTQVFYQYVSVGVLFVMAVYLILGNFSTKHGRKFKEPMKS